MPLDRLVTILEIVGQKHEVTVAEICAHSALPKPTVYRLVQDLVGAGLLEPAKRGRYSLGSRLKRIACRDGSDRMLVKLLAPLLRRSAIEHGAAFFLSRLRGRSVEIIHVEVPDGGVSYLHPGLGARPLHACSCSKVVAAFSPELSLNCDPEGDLKAYTENTITSIEELDAELEAIRKRGYAECVEEIERGMCSVAAPLSETGLGATMSIGASGSLRVFTPRFREKIGGALKTLAAECSTRLALPEADEAQVSA